MGLWWSGTDGMCGRCAAFRDGDGASGAAGWWRGIFDIVDR